MPTVTIDGQAIRSAGGRDDPRGRPPQRRLDPDALPPRRAGAVRGLPDLRGGDRPRAAGGRWSPPATTRSARDLTVRVKSERAVRGRQGVMRAPAGPLPGEPGAAAELAARMGVRSARPIRTSPRRSGTASSAGCACGCATERIGASAISPAGRGVERAVADALPAGLRRTASAAGPARRSARWARSWCEVHDDEVEISPFEHAGEVAALRGLRRAAGYASWSSRPLASAAGRRWWRSSPASRSARAVSEKNWLADGAVCRLPATSRRRQS